MKEVGLGEFIAQNLAYVFSTKPHIERYYKAIKTCEDLELRTEADFAECFPMDLGSFKLHFRTIGEDTPNALGQK